MYSNKALYASVTIKLENRVWLAPEEPLPDEQAQNSFNKWLLSKAINLTRPITPDAVVQVNLRRAKPCWGALFRSDEPGIYYGAAGDFSRIWYWHSTGLPQSLDQRRRCLKARNHAQQIRRRADRVARREIDAIQQLLSEAA